MFQKNQPESDRPSGSLGIFQQAADYIVAARDSRFSKFHQPPLKGEFNVLMCWTQALIESDPSFLHFAALLVCLPVPIYAESLRRLNKSPEYVASLRDMMATLQTIKYMKEQEDEAGVYKLIRPADLIDKINSMGVHNSAN